METIWQQIAHTTAQEFSDLGDVAQVTRLIIRLLTSAVLGGLLGWQREQAGKSAGVRTHMLVAMGGSLFIQVAHQSGIDSADSSRVLQGIIAGVGFLGAGTILKAEAEHQVQGLTTAAGIWLTAAIGIACGLGLEVTAVVSTLLALAVLCTVPWLQEKLSRTPTPVSQRKD